MARRKRHYEEPENLERWLVSYADFITLLFAFFVVLYAISSVNEGKYRVLSDSIVTAFKTMPRSLDPVQIGEINRIKRKSFIDAPVNEPIVDSPRETGRDSYESMTLKEMSEEIEKAMRELIDEGTVNVRRTDNWLEIEINTRILFPSGSARFERKATDVLKEIAEILSPFPNPLNVEGFTDNIPIKTIAYPSNWELSAARAASVVSLFAKEGVSPERMSAIGYGEHRPIADNASAKGRDQNRRVVIAVLAQDFHLRSSREQTSTGDIQSGRSTIR